MWDDRVEFAGTLQRREGLVLREALQNEASACDGHERHQEGSHSGNSAIETLPGRAVNAVVQVGPAGLRFQ